ncbi:MAG: hypothetical protein E7214_12720 [Clostridium sp.]|nr:hypothetical protein [Clostridium sp.]
MLACSISGILKKVRKEELLDENIKIRINSKEKVLFEKYAKIRGLKLEEMIKALVRKDIDDFIKG